MQQSIEVIPRPESEASSHLHTSESGDDQVIKIVKVTHFSSLKLNFLALELCP